MSNWGGGSCHPTPHNFHHWARVAKVFPFECFLRHFIHSCKNSTNLQTWLGGRIWLKNEKDFVDSALIPFSWESGNQLMNRFPKTEVSLTLKPC